MTENMTTWRDDEETILDSDIWRAAKNLTPMSPEEELEAWRKTVRALNALCMMGDGLVLDPLSLALVDAKDRAEEELERARERTMRPAEELTEYERDTLDALWQRSNALSNAWALYVEHGTFPHREKELEILNEMSVDADEQFARYRREVGLED